MVRSASTCRLIIHVHDLVTLLQLVQKTTREKHWRRYHVLVGIAGAASSNPLKRNSQCEIAKRNGPAEIKSLFGAFKSFAGLIHASRRLVYLPYLPNRGQVQALAQRGAASAPVATSLGAHGWGPIAHPKTASVSTPASSAKVVPSRSMTPDVSAGAKNVQLSEENVDVLFD